MLSLNMLTLLILQFPVKGLTAYITQVSCSYYKNHPRVINQHIAAHPLRRILSKESIEP